MKPRISILLAVLLALPGALPAQFAEPDSARVAREAWRQAVPLIRRQDWAAARDIVRRAFQAWPAQQVYVSAYAALSARVLDTAETLRGLSLLADLGFSAAVDSDPSYLGVRGAPTLRAVSLRLAANAAPLVKSRVAATLAQDDFYPEGISHDPAKGVWYLASVRHRKVSRVRKDGSTEEFIKEGQDGLWAVLGVRADPASGTLWLSSAAIPQMAGYAPADSGRAAIFAFDLESGKLKARYLLPTSPGHLIGDLTVAPDGSVYATDSQEPVIWRIVKGGDEVQEFLRHPLFRNLQGPAIEPSGRILYVADYSHGIIAIDLNTRQARALVPPPRTTVLGIDGLSWHNGSLIGVQNGVSPARIVRIRLDSGGQRILGVDVLDRNLAVATEPTIGTIWGGKFFYVANSQWDEYDDNGRLKTGIRLEPPRILELKLP